MIIIVDYDTGNTRNVQKALDFIGLESQISDQAADILAADGLILPGVGAYALAMEQLKQRNLISVLNEAVERGIPLLGVCLGMQLLLEGSMEYGYHDGLGFIPGICEKLPEEKAFPVPHMGWNQLMVTQENALTKEIAGEYFYFVHSYYADCEQEYIDGLAQYSLKVPAVISKGNVYGAQFHPEKSGEAGMTLLKGFKEVVDHASITRN
ncbi:imidazole glycerol phosphate synthase subunit HisH [Enterococcus sp. LJL120]